MVPMKTLTDFIFLIIGAVLASQFGEKTTKVREIFSIHFQRFQAMTVCLDGLRPRARTNYQGERYGRATALRESGRQTDGEGLATS